MIICFHIISKVSFFQTAAIWNIGLIEYFLLKLIIKITDSMLIHNNILAPDLLNSITVISIAILILFFLSKYIKKPLKQYMLELKSVWFITCLPLIFACVLFSYASWSTVNLVLIAILLLIFIVIFLTLAKMLNSAYEAMRLKQNEFNLEIQIETQKHEYKEICSKMEKGRAFRHDMHHHFSTLNSLLQQGETEDALSYIHNLNNEYIEIEQELFCENSTVNAILTYYTQQAKNTNCLFDVNVKIGKEPVFEDMDLCVIFSNSLENAINACKKIEDKCQRHISVSANCQNGKLAISVQNSCFELIKFDQDGFPIVPKTEGHGVGLKSIESVTKKYNGVFSCSLIENVFSIKTVIFANNELPPTVKKASKSVLKQVVLNACFLIFSFSLFINATPALAATFENIPIANQLIRIITLKSFGFQWGDSQLKIDHPIVELEKSADINNALTSPNTSSTFSEENLSSLDNLNPLSSTSTDNTSLTSSQKKQNMDNETTSPKRKDEITVNDSNSFPIIVQKPSTSDDLNEDSNSSTENNPDEENSSDLSEGIDKNL
ncbi:MAG: GHKL domain-containing protein [Oscillospiraceae bacterium]